MIILPNYIYIYIHMCIGDFNNPRTGNPYKLEDIYGTIIPYII